MTKKGADEYIEKMVKNARKHGILITTLTATVPMGLLTYNKVFTENIRNMQDADLMTESVDKIHSSLHMAREEAEKLTKAINSIKELFADTKSGNNDKYDIKD